MLGDGEQAVLPGCTRAPYVRDVRVETDEAIKRATCETGGRESQCSTIGALEVHKVAARHGVSQ